MGEAPGVKTVELPSAYGAKPVEACCTNKRFSAELKENDGVPILAVRVKDAGQEARAFVQVRTDFPGDTPRWVGIPVQVLDGEGIDEPQPERSRDLSRKAN